MSKAKYTPGPWTFTVYPPEEDGIEDLCAYIDNAGGHVAHCMPPAGIDTQIRDANARLIAAAPELLAALQALVGWEDAEIKHFGATGPDDWIMEDARAAIAKALGDPHGAT